MLSLVEPAPAKVNLYLHVTGRRADGYHILDSLAVFPAAGDRLVVEPADTLSLVIDGPFAPVLQHESDNLVLRAARALAARDGLAPRARLRLTKNLPVASGIGGGSADAAAALRLLSRLWHVPPADISLAAGLGADVPVCLASRPVRMGGIGEILLPAPALPPGFIVLVNAGMAVATPAVFRARRGDFSPPATLAPGWPDLAALVADLLVLRNDLEEPAIALQPVIADVLAALRTRPGCELARMSGSGATCFGLFAQAEAARTAAERLRTNGWWCWDGPLQGVAESPDRT